MKLKSISIALLLTGILLFSTSAFAYDAGPTKIGGNLGDFVAFNTVKEREAKYADACYFTSEGLVCPSLNVVTVSHVMKQPSVETSEVEKPKGYTESLRAKTVSKATETPGRTMIVTSITGNPGSFTRWNNRRREQYAAQSCYYSVDSTASRGNLVCPANLNYGYDSAQSFRTPEAKLVNLVAVGKQDLGGNEEGYASRNRPGVNHEDNDVLDENGVVYSSASNNY